MRPVLYFCYALLAGSIFFTSAPSQATELDPNDPGDQAIRYAYNCQNQANKVGYSEEVWKSCDNTYRWLIHPTRNISALTPVQQNKYTLAKSMGIATIMAIKTSQNSERVGKSTCVYLSMFRTHLADYSRELTPEWNSFYDKQRTVEKSLTHKCQQVME